MKVSVDLSTLKNAVSVVSTALATKDAQNEWSKGIKVEAKDGKVTLYAADSTLSSKVVLNSTVTGEGEFLINGSLLSKLIDCFADNVVEIENSDTAIIIKCGKDRGEYEKMRVEDFSFTDAPKDANWFTVPAELIADAKDKVGFAAAKAEIRPKLSSIYFAVEDGELLVVATDGTRLARYKTVAPEGFNGLDNVLIMCDLMGRISSGLKTFGVKDKVELALQPDRMFFRSEGVLFSSGLVNDTYLNYKKIIPSEEKINFVISFNNKDLARKVKIAKVVDSFSTDSKDNVVRIKGTEEGFGEGNLVVLNSGGANKQNGEISYTAEKGDVPKEFVIAVNADHILEIMGKLGDEVQLEINTPTNPFIIKTKGSKDEYIIVIMPKGQSKPEAKSKE